MKVILPEYPKTEVDGTSIIIRYEDGSVDLWGFEKDALAAAEAAKEIEMGLRCIYYVERELIQVLTKLGEELECLEIPPEHIKDYLAEGYCRVYRWFRELENL